MQATDTFLRRLQLDHPIIQAPMAGISTPRLAAAVSNAGGLGSLGIGACTVAQAREVIEATRRLSDRAFGVNVFCHAPAQPGSERDLAWIRRLTPLFSAIGAEPPTQLQEIYRSFLADEAALALLLELRPAAVSFHFGVPGAAQISALRSAGIYTMASVTRIEEAAAAEAAGVDALIAQGIEAGGHRGMFEPAAVDEQLSTAVLLRILLGHSRLPVIAAGGIMDGQGIRAALALGAVAAQLGTAFLLCPESAAGEGYRAALKDTRHAHTRLTAVLSGRPARGLCNRLIDHAEADPDVQPAAYPLAYDLAKQLISAYAKAGHHDVGAYWAGQGVPLIRELPAAELMQVLLNELEGSP